MAYDLLIKGGEVVDPAQGVRGQMDVAIAGGKIASLESDIPSGESASVLDAQGALVVPGLIDFHLHLGAVHGQNAGDPDDLGVRQGVTTIVEGGSLGSQTFDAATHIDAARQTDVRWFINLASRGMSHLPEIASEADVDPEATINTIWENGDRIVGVKLRAIGTVAGCLGPRAVEMAKRVAASAGLPVMVHVGACFSELNDERALAAVDNYVRDILPLLEAGDIVSHIYSPKRGRVSDAEMNPLPELLAARKRGVLLEVAHGETNFSSLVARHMIDRGIQPDILSTDGMASGLPSAKSTLVGASHTPFYDESDRSGPVAFLARIMSKMLALGFSLEQVVAMVTANPARALGKGDQIGTLRPGAAARVTVLEMVERKTTFWDGLAPTSVEGTRLLVPSAVITSHGSNHGLLKLN